MVGSLTDERIKDVLTEVNAVVVCWGNDGSYLGRDKEVLELLKTMLKISQFIVLIKINQDSQNTHYMPVVKKIGLNIFKILFNKEIS